MNLSNQMKSPQQQVVANLDQEDLEEENQVFLKIGEALITNLEIVFLNQEEEAQDQAAMENQMPQNLKDQASAESKGLMQPEDLKEMGLEDQTALQENQILMVLENQALAINQKLVELEKQAAAAPSPLVIHQANHTTRKKDQSQKLAGKRNKLLLFLIVISW